MDKKQKKQKSQNEFSIKHGIWLVDLDYFILVEKVKSFIEIVNLSAI